MKIYFGSSILNKMWKRGELPTVIKGIYGDILTKQNLSTEHLKPKSQGGLNVIDNFALATKENNNNRGTKPLREVLTWGKIHQYLVQFVNIKTKDFDGNDYISRVFKTLSKELANE